MKSSTSSTEQKVKSSESTFPLNNLARQLRHSISIVVYPDKGDSESDEEDTSWSLRPESTQRNLQFPGASNSRKSLRPFEEQTLSSNPILVIDDHLFEAKRSKSQDNLVEAVMESAKSRKQELARLLEEHAQIVREIKRRESCLNK